MQNRTFVALKEFKTGANSKQENVAEISPSRIMDQFIENITNNPQTKDLQINQNSDDWGNIITNIQSLSTDKMKDYVKQQLPILFQTTLKNQLQELISTYFSQAIITEMNRVNKIKAINAAIPGRAKTPPNQELLQELVFKKLNQTIPPADKAQISNYIDSIYETLTSFPNTHLMYLPRNPSLEDLNRAARNLVDRINGSASSSGISDLEYTVINIQKLLPSFAITKKSGSTAAATSTGSTLSSSQDPTLASSISGKASVLPSLNSSLAQPTVSDQTNFLGSSDSSKLVTKLKVNNDEKSDSTAQSDYQKDTTSGTPLTLEQCENKLFVIAEAFKRQSSNKTYDFTNQLDTIRENLIRIQRAAAKQEERNRANELSTTAKKLHDDISFIDRQLENREYNKHIPVLPVFAKQSRIIKMKGASDQDFEEAYKDATGENPANEEQSDFSATTLFVDPYIKTNWTSDIDTTHFRLNTIELFPNSLESYKPYEDYKEAKKAEANEQKIQFDEKKCAEQYKKENTVHFAERLVGDSNNPRLVSNFNLPDHLQPASTLATLCRSGKLGKFFKEGKDPGIFVNLFQDYFQRIDKIPTVPVSKEDQKIFEQGLIKFLEAHKNILNGKPKDLAKKIAKEYIEVVSDELFQDQLRAAAMQLVNSFLAARTSNTPLTISGKNTELSKHVIYFCEAQNLDLKGDDHTKITYFNETSVLKPSKELVIQYKNDIQRMLNEEAEKSLVPHLGKQDVKQLVESAKEFFGDDKSEKIDELGLKQVKTFPRQPIDKAFHTVDNPAKKTTNNDLDAETGMKKPDEPKEKHTIGVAPLNNFKQSIGPIEDSTPPPPTRHTNKP